jgi:hypothetical protein
MALHNGQDWQLSEQEDTLVVVEEEAFHQTTSKKNPHSGGKRKAKEGSRSSISIAEMQDQKKTKPIPYSPPT